MGERAAFDEAHSAVAVGIAECFLAQPRDMPWEARTDELATAAIEAMQLFIQARRDALAARSLDDPKMDEAELVRLAERATRISGEIRYRDKGDGEERYDVIGAPCGFPVATFGDHNDAAFFVAAHHALRR